MSRNKPLGKKLKLISRAKRRPAPRWADIKKFGLKRARTRRVRVRTKHWRRGRLKV
ncbi:MAG: 50S ribosomal protein L39e [Candidatus Aenigmatarchaeota archaeon]|nr:50S ribosomal protein L39e [Nanoarchaeota archaeon]